MTNRKTVIKGRSIKATILAEVKKLIQIEKNYDVKIEYLEARREKDLSITNSIKKSRIFVAYYLDKVRLIDNF